jgi:hypothetical protein
MGKQSLKFFEDCRVRSIWDEKAEKWYFSVVDVVAILIGKGYQDARKYWNKLAQRLRNEGAEQSVTNCHRLKLEGADGKRYLTDVADMETVFRIVQSIPSKKAEPIKIWLAQVGRDRIDEIVDPELAIDRAMRTYERKGYSREWINLRLKSIDVRKELTDEWEDRGIKRDKEFAILTDDITRAWSGMTTRTYKDFKNLKQESLRDNMSTVELVLNMLGEVSTTEISKAKRPETFPQNREVAREGGTVAGKARAELEALTGMSAISPKKFSPPEIVGGKGALEADRDNSSATPALPE